MKTADIVMEEMLEVFKERKETYGNNYLIIGKVLAALYPNGLVLNTEEDHNKYHLFLLVLVKATRLANTGLTHEDSAKDLAVYAAMLTGLLTESGDEHESNSI